MNADVVVAGYGPAGAGAAIAAHDAGRSVVVVESAGQGGGNARYSGGFLFDRPVPGLYAAGAVSLVWGHLIEHGGGLTDAIVFGRIAGEQAASRAASAALAATAPGVTA